MCHLATRKHNRTLLNLTVIQESVPKGLPNCSVSLFVFVWKGLKRDIISVKYWKLENVKDDFKGKQLFQEGIKINLNIQYSISSFLMTTVHNWSIFWFMVILLIQMCSESAFSLWIDTVCCIGEVFLSRAHPSVNHNNFIPPLLSFCT